MESSIQNVTRKLVLSEETTDGEIEIQKLKTTLNKEMVLASIEAAKAIKEAKGWKARTKHIRTLKELLQLGAMVESIKFGSVVWTLQFESELSLKKFEEIYKSGEITKMLQEDFVTEDFLDRHSLEAAGMKVDVKEEYIEACRKEILDGK